MSTSTRFSRRLVIGPLGEYVTEIKTGTEGVFAVNEPRHLRSGTYRAILDPETRTATITEETP